MEQPHSGKGHEHIITVAAGNDRIVPDGTAGLGHIVHAAGVGPLDIVVKGEERIGTQGNAPDAV